MSVPTIHAGDQNAKERPEAVSWHNTRARYGRVAMVLHWLTALLILVAFPLGMIANAWPYDTAAQFAVKADLFSVHKTLGIAAFGAAILRIVWAFTQTRPAPLHPGRRGETLMAECVHWSLYLAMVIVPLSGWLHHAATTGFAPIWWPFGQGLPLVPESVRFADNAAAVHWVFTKVLAASILLHVAGALKHHFVDRDDTLRRMLPARIAAGRAPNDAGMPTGGHGACGPILATAFAGAVLALALLVAAPMLSAGTPPASVVSDTAGAQADAIGDSPATGADDARVWEVADGMLGFTVTQMGSPVTGTFAEWNARIHYDPDAPASERGEVEVVIAIDSLTLGSVTRQAKGEDFLNVDDHPQSRFVATIAQPDDAAPGAYLAEGRLELAGESVPVTLSFTLVRDGDEAQAEGLVRVDRRDFAIGEGHPDESAVGFGVEIFFDLQASRRP
ncbi:MAG: cytochrome b/b6 domain-containing protein [Salinarimonas sp.]|nr:cytochrome b/b6 domain-containing protein [Salinarimonas sp.]